MTKQIAGMSTTITQLRGQLKSAALKAKSHPLAVGATPPASIAAPSLFTVSGVLVIESLLSAHPTGLAGQLPAYAADRRNCLEAGVGTSVVVENASGAEITSASLGVPTTKSSTSNGVLDVICTLPYAVTVPVAASYTFVSSADGVIPANAKSDFTKTVSLAAVHGSAPSLYIKLDFASS